MIKYLNLVVFQSGMFYFMRLSLCHRFHKLITTAVSSLSMRDQLKIRYGNKFMNK